MAGKLGTVVGGIKAGGGKVLDYGAKAYMLGQVFGDSNQKMGLGSRIGGALLGEISKATLGEMGALGKAIGAGAESRARKAGSAGGNVPSSSIPYQQIKGGDVVAAINQSSQQIVNGLNVLNATQRMGFNAQTNAIQAQAGAIGSLKRDTEDTVIILRDIYEVLNKMGYQQRGAGGGGGRASPLAGDSVTGGAGGGSMLKNILAGLLAQQLLDSALDRRPGGPNRPGPKSPGILKNMWGNLKSTGLTKIGGGVGGVLGGLALDYGSEYAKESGYGKTGAGLSILSSALSGAGAGSLAGAAFGGVGAVPGAIVGGLGGLGYGLYNEGANLFGGGSDATQQKAATPSFGDKNVKKPVTPYSPKGVTLINRKAIIKFGDQKGTIVHVLWLNESQTAYTVKWPDGKTSETGKRTLEFIDESSSRGATTGQYDSMGGQWSIGARLPIGTPLPGGGVFGGTGGTDGTKVASSEPLSVWELLFGAGDQPSNQTPKRAYPDVLPPPTFGQDTKMKMMMEGLYVPGLTPSTPPEEDIFTGANSPWADENLPLNAGQYLVDRQKMFDNQRSSLVGSGRPGFIAPNTTRQNLQNQEMLLESQQPQNQIEIKIQADKITYEADELIFDVDKLTFKTTAGGGAGGGGGGGAGGFGGFGGAGGGMGGFGGDGGAGGLGGGGADGGGGGGSEAGPDATAVSSSSLSPETKAAAGALQSKGTFSVPKGGADPFANYSDEQLRSQGVVSHTNADGTKVYSHAPGGIGSHADRIGGGGATQAVPQGGAAVGGMATPSTAGIMQGGTGKAMPTGAVSSAMEKAASDMGVDPRLIWAKASVESRYQAGAKSPLSSASGLGQILKGTWKEIAAYPEAKKYGITGNPNERFDPYKSAVASMLYSQKNIESLKKDGLLTDEMLAQNPGLYYIPHNLGLGGAKRFLKGMRDNPNAPVSQFLTAKEINNNPSIYKKGGRVLTAGEALGNIEQGPFGQGFRTRQKMAEEGTLPPVGGAVAGAPGAAPTATAPSLEAGLAGMTPANAPAATQAAASPVTGEGVGAVNQLQQGKIRGQMLNERTEAQLRYISQMAGVEMDVTSGEQMDLEKAKAMGARKVGKQWVLPNGKVVRTGSTRHDESTGAADVKFKDPKTGKYIDIETPEGRAKAQEIVKYAAQAGMTGFGYGTGYMGRETMHLGGGSATSWNKTGKASRVGWIEEARKQGLGMGSVDAVAWLKQQQEKQLAAGQLNVQEPSAANLPETSPLAMTPAKKARIQQAQRDALYTRQMMSREGGMAPPVTAQPVAPPVQNPVSALSQQTEMNREAAVTSKKNKDATSVTNNIYNDKPTTKEWGPDPQSPSKFDFRGWSDLLEQTGLSTA